MSEQNKSHEDKAKQEIKRLKRKNRRLDAVVLITLLQVGSLVLAYYLGHSVRKDKEN